MKPRAVERTAAHVDLLPTLASLCGLEPPTTHPLDGRSVVPLLRGAKWDASERPIVTYRPTDRGLSGAIRTERWRWVRDRGRDQLFDMRADPGQKRDLAEQQPEVLARHRESFESFARTAAEATATPVPIPVGYAESPSVELPGVEATLTGNVKFANGNGWAHDWIDGWTSTDDTIVWSLDVATAGEYEVTLSYGCPRADVGSKLELTAGDAVLRATIERAHDPPRRERPERSKAKGARLIRDFTSIRLGTITLPRGPITLQLRATHVPAGSVADVDALRLRKQ